MPIQLQENNKVKLIGKINNRFNEFNSVLKRKLLSAFMFSVSLIILWQAGFTWHPDYLLFPAIEKISMPLRLHHQGQSQSISQMPGKGLPRSSLQHEPTQ